MLATTDDERRRFYGDAQRAVAEDAPYISLWYKTNVAVSRPQIEGVKLTPSAEFTFLRKVTKGPIRPIGLAFQLLDSRRASDASCVSACCSTISVRVLRASSVFPASW